MSLEVNIEKKLDGFTLRLPFRRKHPHCPAGRVRLRQKHDPALHCRHRAGRTEGRIVLDGRVLFDSAQGIDLPPQQRNVGLLFQNYALFPNMTVEQNILCALKKEKGPCRPQSCLCRGIAGHAAGRTGQAPARHRFRAGSSSVPPCPHPWRPNPAS